MTALRFSRKAAIGTLAACALIAVSASASAAPALSQHDRPNILVVLLDDAGFMDFGAYGGDAATPNIDRLAAQGVMFSRFYMSPQCGPSRAMLLTGRDNHEVGLGSIPEAMDPDFRRYPGYSMRWEDGTRTIASRLREAGYQTFVTGKWGIGDVGKNLPHRFGFDRSFVMDSTGGSNFDHTPYLPLYDRVEWFEDGEPVTLPETFYSSRDIVDRMIDYIDEAEPDRPFFGYVSLQAIHLPIQVPREYTERYNGIFDRGWEVMRTERLQRAIALGLVPQSTTLAPLPPTSRGWADLSEAERAYWARSMQVNAGMLEAADHHVGRLLEHVAAKGRLENTLVIVSSDNGPESATIGHQEGLIGVLTRLWLRRTGWSLAFDTLGERGSMAAIGEEWASVSAAPFKLFKFNATEGGLRVPLVIAGPGVPQAGVLQGRAHVIDLVPTILEAAGLDPLREDLRGRSLVPMLSGERREVYGEKDAVGFEVGGNAALYRGRWKLSRVPLPRGDGQWHLYDLSADPGEVRDLAATHPAVLRELLDEYRSYADEVGVVEVDASFNPFKQVEANATAKMARKYWPYLAALGIALVATLALLGRVAFAAVRRKGT